MRLIGLRLVVAALLASGCWSSTLPERDRGALLTIADLHVYGIERPDSSHESFKRTWYLDGSSDMEYNFESAGDSGNIGLTAVIDLESTVGAAREDVLLSRGMMTAGLKIAGVTLQQDSAASYGDESYFATAMKGPIPVGHLVVVRRDAVVYTVLLIGVVFDTSNEWPILLEPKFAFVDSMRRARS